MQPTIQKSNIFERLSIFVVAALGFLMPTFFLTNTTEFYEFNKLALLTISTLILVGLLTAKVLRGEGINFQKTSIDLSLTLFLITMLLSTLFSIDKTSSIWGSQGRWFPSLFGALVFVLFYYLSGPNFKNANDIKLAIFAFIGGATVSSLVATLSYFKVFLGSTPYLKIAEFTLVGSPTSAMILAALGAVFAFYFLYKEEFVPLRALLATATIVNFLYVALTSKPLGWILLTGGIALAVNSLEPVKIMQDRFVSMFLMTALITITLVCVFPSTREIIANKEYSYELTLPVKESWIVAAASIQDYPLLATGPSTFGLNFSKYRPLSLNGSTLWSVRFDKPFNELFNVIATLGVIGLVAFLLFGGKTLKLAIHNYKSKEQSGVANILAIGVILILVSYIGTYATVLNTFLLFFFIALMSAADINLIQNQATGEIVELSFASFAGATTTIGNTGAIKREYANIIAITPLTLVTIIGIYFFARTYLGEFFMRKAIVAATNNQAIQAYDLQGKAVNFNPRRSNYHSSYAQTNLAIANAMAANPNLTDQDKQTIQTLVAQSIRSTRVATEVVSPSSVVDWETRGLIYRSLINVADNASDWAIAAYNTAIQLEPSNPALRIDLGGVYFVAGDFLSAANMFRQAATLKPDYANAHYNFAQALVNMKDFENAKRELETVKGLVPADSADYKLVEQQIAALNVQAPSVAGASTGNKPTIEEITKNKDLINQTQQAPLTTPDTQDDTKNLNTNALPSNQDNNTTPQPRL